MKKLYLIGIIVVFLMILIMALPQIGAICSWYTPIGTTANPVLPLLQIAGLGMVLGGLVVLYWKTPIEEEEETEEETELGTSMKEESDEDEKEDDKKDED